MLETIVFVHGFLGWGRDENIVDYWNDDIIKKHFPNHKTHIASVGAISSNWDRACELYAQIKGGTVDYGGLHSSTCNHKRYGRTYEGFFPEWSVSNPIILIGHSMGGQTIRQLEKLIQVGDSGERGFDGVPTCGVPTCGVPTCCSPLFRGLGGGIKKVITISTPHMGSPLFDIFGDTLVDKIKDTVVRIGINMKESDELTRLYDMDIEHYNLGKMEDETNEKYKERIENHPIWDKDYKDISSWDLSVSGSKEFNMSSASVYPGVHYLAVSTHRTFGLFGWAFPSFWMLPGLSVTSLLMGLFRYGGNDGLVPSSSSRGPCESIPLGSEDVRSGRWYYVDSKLDHLQVLGIFPGWECRVDSVFETISKFIDN